MKPGLTPSESSTLVHSVGKSHSVPTVTARGRGRSLQQWGCQSGCREGCGFWDVKQCLLISFRRFEGRVAFAFKRQVLQEVFGLFDPCRWRRYVSWKRRELITQRHVSHTREDLIRYPTVYLPYLKVGMISVVSTAFLHWTLPALHKATSHPRNLFEIRFNNILPFN